MHIPQGLPFFTGTSMPVKSSQHELVVPSFPSECTRDLIESFSSGGSCCPEFTEAINQTNSLLTFLRRSETAARGNCFLEER